MEDKYGVMVCGHGSRDEDAVSEFLNFAKKLKNQLLQYELDWGFLEFANPVIKSGLDSLREKGIREIMSVPVMLFAAGHAKNDIPSVLNAYQAQYPELSISYGRELGIDLKLIRAAGERVKDAIEQADGDISPEETLLMVVGRGASDPDANSNVSKVTRMLWEGLGLGWAETAYSGVTFPLIKPGLEHASKLGYKRIVVFPYFLFTGILVKRIYQYTDMVAAEHPEIQFVKASYLNDHPLVLDTFSERVEEIRNGVNNMNCKLCKYREQFLGFENEVGLRQESHHHHVEGIGTGHSHSQGHVHSHDHDHPHDHGHHPYPHADHPLGPKTLEQESSQGNH
ncbi:MAG: sirohydrochlorin chelatase [SAR324 cluster bacterium]|nr:sirohydrochlorin chelatase [SAR324 cluster bacterium]